VYSVLEFGGGSHVTPSSLPSDRSTLFLKLGRGDEQAHVLPLDHRAPRFSRALHRSAHLDMPLRLLSLTIDIGPPSPNLLCTAVVAALAYPGIHELERPHGPCVCSAGPIQSCSVSAQPMGGRDAPPSATTLRCLWTPTCRPSGFALSSRPKPREYGSGFGVCSLGAWKLYPSYDDIGPPSACSIRVQTPFQIISFA
jgi:hypothetical protein